MIHVQSEYLKDNNQNWICLGSKRTKAISKPLKVGQQFLKNSPGQRGSVGWDLSCKVKCLIPGQGIYLGLWFSPQLGHVQRQPINASLPHLFLSLSFSFLCPLSRNKWNLLKNKVNDNNLNHFFKKRTV